MPQVDPSAIRFGVFELDLKNLELRKAGSLIRLPPQPFKVLALLANHPGELVTRDDIQHQIWMGAAYVDFERGINHCVSQIRAVLEDDAETPRYIQTLPRRGYRFIAPISGETGAPVVSSDRSPLSSLWNTSGFRLGALCLVVVLAATVFGLKHAATEQKAKLSKVPLAVLPFDNLSGDPRQDYFAEGMTEALITQLGKFSGLRVTSKQSVMHFNGVDSPANEIARELNVNEIVKGSVIQSNGRVRITAQLIDPTSGSYVWSDSYEGDIRNILTLQSEVASAIASKIKIVMTPQERENVKSLQGVNPAAHEDYLRGRYYWNKRTREALNRSIEYFELAIKEDPQYAPAYAGLADSYNLLAFSGALAPKVAYPEATRAAMKALQLDDTLADAHTSLADIRSVYEWKWSEAEKEYRRAIELNTSYAIAHQWYASYLVAMGRTAESISEAKQALELDPLSLMINSNLGWSYYLAGRDDEAIEHYRVVIEMDPNFGPAHLNLGRAYEQKEMFAPAILEIQKAISLSNETPSALAALGYAYGVAGQMKEATETADRLKTMSQKGYVPPYDLAVIYAGLGNKDEALRWLQQAYQERSGELLYIKVDPRLVSLRADRKFLALTREMGL
jgi:TolB-like protein/DNA-binding winged helix-turn-helix (wHTH) protein/Flp pilus assembly protein TadD